MIVQRPQSRASGQAAHDRGQFPIPRRPAMNHIEGKITPAFEYAPGLQRKFPGRELLFLRNPKSRNRRRDYLGNPAAGDDRHRRLTICCPEAVQIIAQHLLRAAQVPGVIVNQEDSHRVEAGQVCTDRTP